LKILQDTKDVEHAIVELLREATTEAWLVSPYISFEKLQWVKRAILDALERKVPVHLFVREDGPKTREVEREAVDLVEHGLDLRCVRNLHAKVYWSERSAVLTSLNLLASSMNNSIEVGVRLDQGDAHAQVKHFVETQVVRYAEEMPERRQAREREEERIGLEERDRLREIEREAERARQQEATRIRELERELERAQQLEAAKHRSLELQAELVKTREVARLHEAEKARRSTSTAKKPAKALAGYCIRCGNGLPFNPDKPYCAEHFASWRRYEDPDYQEKKGVCHDCGEPHPATMRKPMCRPCWDARGG
jgi:ribosomal protein L37E